MEFVYGLMGLAVFFAIAWAFSKADDLAFRGANRGVFRGEYKQGRQLLRSIRFDTSAPVADVMRELDTYVSAVDAALGINAVLYEVRRTDASIVWKYGTRADDKMQVILGFLVDEDGTHALFAVAHWQEADGILSIGEVLETLRMQVTAAFQAADPAVLISNDVDDGAEAQRFAPAFRAKP